MTKTGFTLVEMMISLALVGVTAIGVVSLMKMQKETESSAMNSVELSQVRSQILAMLTHPAHCQANFAGATFGSSAMTDFYQCNTVTSANACRGAGAPISKYPVHTSSWDQINTNISNRVRLRSITRNIENILAIPNERALTTGVLDLEFEIKLNNGATRIEKFKFVAPVIFSFNPLDGVYNNAVVGCPKTWGSTVVY